MNKEQIQNLIANKVLTIILISLSILFLVDFTSKQNAKIEQKIEYNKNEVKSLNIEMKDNIKTLKKDLKTIDKSIKDTNKSIDETNKKIESINKTKFKPTYKNVKESKDNILHYIK